MANESDLEQVKIAPTKLIVYQINCEGGYSEVNTGISKDLFQRVNAHKLEGDSLQLELSEIYHSSRNSR